MSILIVEDEPKTARQLQHGLRNAGFVASIGSTGESGFELARGSGFEAMLVDIMLPDLSGLEMVKRLRAEGVQTPVLFLSAKGTPEDRIRGLEGGGDDYLVKPYSLPEVVARLRAILRRTQTSAPLPETILVSDLLWEPKQKRITRQGHRIDLTQQEYLLAALLLEHRGEVVHRNQIAQAVWGLPNLPDPNLLDVQIRRLRAKLDDPFPTKLIHTLRGVGIILENRKT